MLNIQVRKKLESLTQLPTIPVVLSEVLNAVDNSELSASRLANLIEKDQALSARVLRVANSPFYGFARKISTIDLAIVVLGLNSIKEIVMSLIIHRFFSSVRKDILDINVFWTYSVFCGAVARVLARKLGYRIAGEAFVAGLMHDIGILILVEHFTKQFIEIRKIQKQYNLSLIEAENIVLKTTHCDIGGWFAEKWNLPEQLCKSIYNHHQHFFELFKPNDIELIDLFSFLKKNNEFLTAIVSLAEYFSDIMGFKIWSLETDKSKSHLFCVKETLQYLLEDEVLDPQSIMEILKHEFIEEFQKAAIIVSSNK